VVKKYIETGDCYIDVSSEKTDYLIREKDILQLIEREIAAMPPRMKEVYTLKQQHYLSTKDIASKLGISEHTVSNHLKKASQHLRKKLGIVIYVLYLLHK
jgi:RNA polymerase sigma-70 factor (ECF subfamily)